MRMKRKASEMTEATDIAYGIERDVRKASEISVADLASDIKPSDSLAPK